MVGNIYFAIALFLFISSARAQDSEIIKNYIKTYCGIAVEEMQRTGVPAAIKLAQGIHETMAGESPLVQKSNNHFGIKCKSGYNGPYVLHDDDRPIERFMKYDSAEQSYRDHSDFLKSRQRYASLFQIDPTNYAAWAYGLKKAGYATNPRYPQLLIGIIEKYNLGDYTAMALGKMEINEDVAAYIAQKNHAPTPTATNKKQKSIYPDGEFMINQTKVIFAQAGSTLSDVAKKYDLSLTTLYNLNDFSTLSESLKKGTLVYLQLKRTQSNKPYHEVVAGEGLYDIAQSEGIRLESLLKYNGLNKYNTPAVGARLRLREDETPTANVLQTDTNNL